LLNFCWLSEKLYACNHWDYLSVIIDGLFKAVDFIVLTILAIVLLIIGIWVFEKKDIPT
jgi:ABC-type transport system involved in multi-copper enzyme maturation permease subunit